MIYYGAIVVCVRTCGTPGVRYDSSAKVRDLLKLPTKIIFMSRATTCQYHT